MPDVLDLVEPGTLERTPPRRLPALFILNLIGEYLLERPARTYFDPVVIGCLVTSLAAAALGVGPYFWVALGTLASLRLLGPCSRLFRDVREDYLLLRYGLVVTAHVIGMRPCRATGGEPAGAYLDCAIPITRRRTSVGSVWIPDSSEALRLSAAGRIPVICLARAPGTWRLRDGDGPHLRYEPARA